ncbi:MAG TPA: hypothetical protein VMQ63_05715 [Stellaceae bacterium]|jgi:hypothetical protein|nr:hypothetical protein [Stellaceae bacterium]
MPSGYAPRAAAALPQRRFGILTMMHRPRCLAILLAAFMLAACTGADITPISDVHYGRWGGIVQVVDREPNVNHVRLGIITAHGTPVDSREQLIVMLQERAAGLGANVIVIQEDRQAAGSNLFFVPVYEMSALAIRTVR